MLAVNDAYRLFSWAEVLYGCDVRWWNQAANSVDHPLAEFAGEKWISTDGGRWNEVLTISKRLGLRQIRGLRQPFFSTDPRFIHYGSNSGFQAINLALLFGANPLVLIGFDFKNGENNRHHFFGSHQAPLPNTMRFELWLQSMDDASKKMLPGVEIINCTPGSAIESFPRADLREVLDGLANRHAA